eukprot:355685-Chlamydomonas_euryale.AAC.3
MLWECGVAAMLRETGCRPLLLSELPFVCCFRSVGAGKQGTVPARAPAPHSCEGPGSTFPRCCLAAVSVASAGTKHNLCDVLLR